MQPPSVPMRFRRQIRQYFIAGLFVVIPVGVSLLAMAWFVVHVDRLGGPLLEHLLGRHVPGFGLLTLLLLILGTGWLASNLPGRLLLEVAEKVLLMVPGLSWMYRTTKQIVDAFSTEGPQAFKKVVLVEHPGQGSWSFGFVTKEVLLETKDASEEMAVVYVPTNHFYLGDYMMVSKSRLRPTQLTVKEGVQIALSAGAAVPERLKAD